MLKVFFLLQLLVSITLGSVCQDVGKHLGRCACYDLSSKIRCSNIRGKWHITETFAKVAPYLNATTVFDYLEIIDTSLFEIPAGAISGFKFHHIVIENNENLENISPEAFDATHAYTTSLSLKENYLNNEGSTEKDIYNFVNKFSLLTKVDLSGNSLSSIPSNAFKTFQNLVDVFLFNNQIRSIGSRPFAGLIKLNQLKLYGNAFRAEELENDSFAGLVSKPEVSITDGAVQYMPESIFKILVDGARKVIVGSQVCGRYGCNYNPILICDNRADWICADAGTYKEKIEGFWCNSKGEDLFRRYCVEKSTLSTV